MQAALQFDALSFGAYLQQPKVFSLDLSKSSILECIDAHIEIKQRLRPRYGKGFFTLKKAISALEFAFRVKLMPDVVSDVFWSHFHAFLLTKLNYKMSTLNTVSSQLISTLNFAAKHGCRLSDTYDMADLHHVDTEQIALSMDEVSHIYHYDIDALPYRKDHLRTLERVRDGFVLACNMGQRYSDMIRIDKSHFDRNKFFIVQQKCGNKAKLNIDAFALDKKTTYAILEKYDYRYPYPHDINGFNKQLHALLRHIGGEFNEEVVKEQKVMGMIRTERKKKYEVISSHTARRTFITVNVLRGKNSYEIRRATGHSDSRCFEKYICTDD